MIQLEVLLEEVCRVAVDCGRYLREEQARIAEADIEYKGSNDYVTYVDRTAEQRIVERLTALPVDASFLTEEKTVEQRSAPYIWVIDPLDGTTNYIHHAAPYCVSIGLADAAEVVLGVVYEVTQDELFFACKGKGAYLTARGVTSRLQVSGCAELSQAFVALGMPYDAVHYNAFVTGLVSKLYGNTGGLRIVGSAAAELCYIAAGRFDARIETDLKAWDIAAGSLILREAGGRITNFNNEEIFLDGMEIIASNNKLHTTIHQQGAWQCASHHLITK